MAAAEHSTAAASVQPLGQWSMHPQAESYQAAILQVFRKQSAEQKLKRIAACLWVQHYGCTACIWSDSLNTVRAAKSFMAGQNTRSIVDNHDLQQNLFDMLGQLDADQVCLNWIPSHLDPTLCETEVEEWVGAWNDVVDHAAVILNDQESSSFWTIFEREQQRQIEWKHILNSFRSFHLEVAEQRRAVPRTDNLEATEPEVFAAGNDFADGDGFLELLPINWRTHGNLGTTLAPQEFG